MTKFEGFSAKYASKNICNFALLSQDSREFDFLEIYTGS